MNGQKQAGNRVCWLWAAEGCRGKWASRGRKFPAGLKAGKGVTLDLGQRGPRFFFPLERCVGTLRAVWEVSLPSPSSSRPSSLAPALNTPPRRCVWLGHASSRVAGSECPEARLPTAFE